MTHGNELRSSLVFLYSNTQQQENLHLLDLIESAQNLTT
ncbi:hypothetical protein [uncultured Gammaproteobacteria bacterium]|nr:hypothetical protein [uncultured Gammaproteobacteria bacterium]CAC9989269.1 hypothetical protein [uncultured Gammaproteobacteria bacterium]